MRTLAEMFEVHRVALIDESMRIIDLEVAEKSGVAGLAIKAGFIAVRSVKPGFVRETVIDLLPEFVVALDPLYQDARGRNVPVVAFFLEHRLRVALLMLAVTDAKAVQSPSATARAAYDRLRGAAQRHVEAAVPRLADLIHRYTGSSPSRG